MHDEIPIADVKKTWGFPRNDGKNPKKYSSKFKISVSDIKKTLGFPRNDGKFQKYVQILKFLLQTLRKH